MKIKMSNVPQTPYSYKKALIAGTLTAYLPVLLMVVGLVKRGTLGSALFILLPLFTGFAVAIVLSPWSYGLAVGLTVVILVAPTVVLLALFSLLILHIEGLICVVMAVALMVPWVLLGALIGVFIGRVMRQRFQSPVNKVMCVGVLVFLVLLSDHVEHRDGYIRMNSVSNSQWLPAPPQDVWQRVKAYRDFSVTKPFLLKLGLPIPLRCELTPDNERIGGRRTCYFREGYVEQRITRWEPPYHMELEVTNNRMPGRHWARLVDAEFELRPEGAGTRIIRTTRYTSTLRPAWYWSLVERLGMEAEHRYVLNQLEANLRRQQR